MTREGWGGGEREASQCQREQSWEHVKRWLGCRRWNFSSHTVKPEWNRERNKSHADSLIQREYRKRLPVRLKQQHSSHTHTHTHTHTHEVHIAEFI